MYFNLKMKYDVQDILYVMLKPVFPKMKAEDPIPKVGATSTKIDLIEKNSSRLSDCVAIHYFVILGESD